MSKSKKKVVKMRWRPQRGHMEKIKYECCSPKDTIDKHLEEQFKKKTVPVNSTFFFCS